MPPGGGRRRQPFHAADFAFHDLETEFKVGDFLALFLALKFGLGARALFLDPDGSGAARYLAREAVTHLLVAGEAAGADLGGYLPFSTDRAALARSDRYTLLRSFDGGRLLLYAVRPLPGPGG